MAANRENIRARGAELGFTFSMAAGAGAGVGADTSGASGKSGKSGNRGKSRIYNTFDAHRLLHWAEVCDAANPAAPKAQKRLKEALFKAYFTDGESPAAHAVLVRLAGEAGLDAARAADIVKSDEFAAEVRERERYYQSQGIHSVPAIIINEQHLISGGQPAAIFEQALRQIAAGAG